MRLCVCVSPFRWVRKQNANCELWICEIENCKKKEERKPFRTEGKTIHHIIEASRLNSDSYVWRTQPIRLSRRIRSHIRFFLHFVFHFHWMFYMGIAIAFSLRFFFFNFNSTESDPICFCVKDIHFFCCCSVVVVASFELIMLWAVLECRVLLIHTLIQCDDSSVIHLHWEEICLVLVNGVRYQLENADECTYNNAIKVKWNAYNLCSLFAIVQLCNQRHFELPMRLQCDCVFDFNKHSFEHCRQNACSFFARFFMP